MQPSARARRWRSRTVKPALGSAAFLLLAPGVVAALIPAWLTGWEMRPGWFPLRAAGVLMIAAGTAALVHAFARFVVDGLGTPAPVAPTERLVLSGLYRYVRNPMYLAVGATIVGQAALLAQPGLLLYAAAFFAAVAAFVHGYEQPTLAARFGAQYDAYRAAVPAWWPRLAPWTEPGGQVSEADPVLPAQPVTRPRPCP
jgi:protein-S-isoprenylcysteine O-methyltransferase Ste14